jgi:hypothetical protein
LISASSEVKKNGAKPVNGKLVFDYPDIVVFKVFEELGTLKNQFGCDEIIYAFDNSTDGYWRKDYYDRYKFGRKKEREQSDIDWNSAFEVFDEIKTILDQHANGKVIDIPRLEADDISFILSEYFSPYSNDTTTLFSIDKDWIHNLVYDNVRFFRSRKTQHLHPIEEKLTKEQLTTKVIEHCVNGDPGDGFKHIKSWTQFSPEFLEMYPNLKNKEQQVYDKHHEIEKRFYDRTQKEAYKHPRFGYKQMLRSKKTLKEVLQENPIHQQNFIRNRKLCLPAGIPDHYKQQVIQAYHNASDTPNYAELQKYFTKYKAFELKGIVSMI